MNNGVSLNIEATIENIEYRPLMCSELNSYSLAELKTGIAFQDASFTLNYQNEKYAFSHWVSPKRTRSYPRARVYNTYKHKNRVTVIPLVKDEGLDGDRDYLQWDTVSLMSLLQVSVIIAYYDTAERNPTYQNKITNQKFNYDYVAQQFVKLSNYQSDSLHWNLQQVNELSKVAKKARHAYYDSISRQTGVKMHKIKPFKTKMKKITEQAEEFKKSSRSLAEQAQRRESITRQPKEYVIRDKARITITNYLGGKYYLTIDEIVVDESTSTIFLIEKKHTTGTLPSISDIKNGFSLMILFTNLEEVKVDGKSYNVKPVLGITGRNFEGYYSNNDSVGNHAKGLKKKYRNRLKRIFEEANENGFEVYAVKAGRKKLEQRIVKSLA